jgi:large subunit ribosomal protein L17
MRHRCHRSKLNRTSEHRLALLKNLSRALIFNGRIRTTVPKARALRPHIEKLITKAKHGIASGDAATSVHKRRLIFAKLQDKRATHALFEQIAPRFMERPGGYTRIVKADFRPGDGAPMAYIEFVDVMDAQEAAPEKKEKSALSRGLDKARKQTGK